MFAVGPTRLFSSLFAFLFRPCTPLLCTEPQTLPTHTVDISLHFPIRTLVPRTHSFHEACFGGSPGTSVWAQVLSQAQPNTHWKDQLKVLNLEQHFTCAAVHTGKILALFPNLEEVNLSGMGVNIDSGILGAGMTVVNAVSSLFGGGARG